MELPIQRHVQMTSASYTYLVPYIFSFLIGVGIAYYTWQHRTVVGTTPYLIYLACQAAIAVLSIFELLAPSLEGKIFWDNVQWITLIVPVSFLMFVLEFTGRQPPNSPRVWGILTAPVLLFLLLVTTNRWHGLTLQNPQLIAGEPFDLLTYEFTTAVYLITSYIYLLTFASFFLLLYQFVHVHRVYRAQIATLFIGFAIPVLGGILAVLDITIFFQRDIFPLTSAVGNIFIAWGLFRYHLFDLVVIGRNIIIENMADIVLVVDLQNRVVDLNPVLARRMGQRRAAIVGQTTNTVFARWPHLTAQLNDPTHTKTEVTLSGTRAAVIFELIFSPIYDQRQQQVGRVIIARDITERKEAEKRQKVLLNLAQAVTISTNLEQLLAYVHQQLDTLMDTTNFYIALYDADTDQYAFPYWADETETDEKAWQPQILAKSYTDYVRRTGEPLLADWEVHHQLVAAGEVALIDTPADLWLGTPLRTPKGIIGVLAVQSYNNPDLYTAKDLDLLAFASDTIALSIERKANEIALAAYRNQLEELVEKRTTQLAQTNEELRREIAEREHAQMWLRSYAQELERSNRELEDFAYISSHDLQEPLRKIQTFADRLQSRYQDQLDEKGQDYVARMQSAAVRSQKLIADLLTYSRVATKGNPFAQTDMNEVVTLVLDDLEVQIVETEAQIHTGTLPALPVDAKQMQLLWQNLLNNALKFCRDGVPPVVEIGVVEDVPVPDGFYRLRVADNGIGFEEKYLDRIFTVFQRLHTRQDFEGTGIGLAICRRIVERHNGRIWATSIPDQGSTFYIELPRTQPGT